MTTGSTSSTRRRLRVVSLLAVFMLVASACTIVGDASTGCDCPNLEATVTSIDWIGDGTIPDEIQSSFQYGSRGDPAKLRVSVYYNTPDRVEVQVQVEERLREAGFDVVETTPFAGVVEAEEWLVSVRTSGGEENPRVSVFVRIVDDDARAAELLAPLVDALGTLP
ncbi:MAG TPA: hypothetical protein ENG98_01230 [Actinobacteria bacterium]|nr:hypothetical protein [Actinomycetota bacterium]